MLESAPKPGPHLSTRPTPDLPRFSFRELAKHHAYVSSQLATQAEASCDPNTSLIDLAQMHAQVALACAAVAPVARQRLIPTHPRSTLGDPVCTLCGRSPLSCTCRAVVTK